MNPSPASGGPGHEAGEVLALSTRVSAAIGTTVLVAIALLTCTSVIGRAFFDSPVLGDVELVQLGIAVVVASFMPYAQAQRANLIVDFFTASARERTQHAMDRAGTVLYTLVMVMVLWRVAVGAIDLRANGERSMLMELPLWWSYALMLPGLSLAVLVGLHQVWCGHAATRSHAS